MLVGCVMVRGFLTVAVSWLAAAVLCAQSVVVDGRVVDENKEPVGGALIRLTQADQEVFAAKSDRTGAFSLKAAPGLYFLTVECEGFFRETNRKLELTLEPERLEIALARALRSESVDVSAVLPPIDVEGTASVRRVTGKQILDIPYPATRNFRNALRIMPGVVQGRGGQLHFDGAMENQVFYTLNGFNVSDPITGKFTTRLTVEAVRSIDYSSGRYSAEFGKGSGGALGIQTVSGDDRLRYAVTNFVPGVDFQTGLHIGSWAPRFVVSGPIRRGRAWFSESLDAEYNQAVIPDLPKGQNRMLRLRGGNLFNAQVNLTPRNLLTGNFLINKEISPRSGVSALDPVSTSVDRRNKQYFWSIRDQIFLPHGMVFDAGFAETRTEIDERPQGVELYRITPYGRGGNHFVNSTQHSSRHQILANLLLPRFQLGGVHQLKTGIDLDRIEYRQSSRRTGYENWGVSGALLSRVTFSGPGSLRVRNFEASSYVVDVWEPKRTVRLEYGVRQDRDSLVGRILLSPRTAVAWSPKRWQSVRLSGGFAVIHDASALSLFARPFDQYAVTAIFNRDGSLSMARSATIFRADRRDLRAPRYRSWSFAAEHRLRTRMRLSLSLLDRRGDQGFTYVPNYGTGEAVDGLPVATVFRLDNVRRDLYDAASINLHHSFGREYEYMASYTRSRAISNAVVDFNVDQPLRVFDNYGPQAWDAPNRAVSWGYLPGWNPQWAVAYLLDFRSGFPYTIQHETGEVVGAVHSQRFPRYFSLNLHIERKLRLARTKFAVRVGVNNITNSLNPSGVNNVVESPAFGAWYGREGRHLVFRLRLLSRE